MSFFDAVNKANFVVEVEKAREGDMPCAQTTTASQPRGTEEDVDEEEEKGELCMSGSFAFGYYGCGVAGGVGEGTVVPPNAVELLSVRICGGCS